MKILFLSVSVLILQRSFFLHPIFCRTIEQTSASQVTMGGVTYLLIRTQKDCKSCIDSKKIYCPAGPDLSQGGYCFANAQTAD